METSFIVRTKGMFGVKNSGWNNRSWRRSLQFILANQRPAIKVNKLLSSSGTWHYFIPKEFELEVVFVLCGSEPAENSGQLFF